MRAKELRPLLRALKGSTGSYKNTKYFGIGLCEFSLHENSVILRGHRVVVPETCRQRVLSELHEGHYGVQKMKNLARQHIWWSSLDKDIHALALRCRALSHSCNKPPRVSHSWEPTTQCFQRIHLDYAGPIQGKCVLLLVDAHSKWLEAFVTSDKTTQTTLRHLRDSVARFGVPSIIVTDNDPTFVSEPMKKFCAVNGTLKMTAPPYSPASSGTVCGDDEALTLEDGSGGKRFAGKFVTVPVQTTYDGQRNRTIASSVDVRKRAKNPT